MQREEIVGLITDSFEYKYRKRDFKLGLILTGVAFALIGLPSCVLIPYQPFAAVIMMLLPIVMMIPAWAINLRKMRELLKDPEKYGICEGVLKNPHPQWRLIYFELHLADGSKLATSPIFNNSQLSERCFDEWNNKRVLVAVDEENGRVAVIRRK